MSKIGDNIRKLFDEDDRLSPEKIGKTDIDREKLIELMIRSAEDIDYMVQEIDLLNHIAEESGNVILRAISNEIRSTFAKLMTDVKEFGDVLVGSSSSDAR